MAIKFNSGATDYLSLAGVPFDKTKDLSIFIYARNNAPVITGADLDDFKMLLFYSDAGDANYFSVISYKNGANQIVTFETSIATVVTQLDLVSIALEQPFAIAVNYDHTTHTFTFYVSTDGIIFTAHGTKVFDISAVTFTKTDLGGVGGTGDIGGLTLSNYRQWEAKLTSTQFNNELTNQNPVLLTNLKYDTPLQTTSDVRNHLNDSQVFTIHGSPTVSLPGPFGAGPLAFITCPEAGDILYYDKVGNLLQWTPRDILIAIDPIQGRVCNICPTRDSNVWATIEHDFPLTTQLMKISPSNGLPFITINLPILVGDKFGNKSFLELPNGDILTVNRDTHALIRLSSTGTVIKTYSITFNPFQGAINSLGSRLIYIIGHKLGIYDLDNDTDLGFFYDHGSDIWMPIWLPDCTVLFLTGLGYLQDGDIVRIDGAGNIIRTYTYSHATFIEGVINIAASLTDNRLWLVGDELTGIWVAELAALLQFELDTGTLIPVFPLVYQFDTDASGNVEPIFAQNTCLGPFVSAVQKFAGLYYIKPDKTNDTLYTSVQYYSSPTSLDVAIPGPFYQTALFNNDQEDVLHFGGIRLRVNGHGNLVPTLKSLDEVDSFLLASIPMDLTTPKEPTRLANFVSQRAMLKLETKLKDETFKINRIILFAKKLWSGL